LLLRRLVSVLVQQPETCVFWNICVSTNFLLNFFGRRRTILKWNIPIRYGVRDGLGVVYHTPMLDNVHASAVKINTFVEAFII